MLLQILDLFVIFADLVVFLELFPELLDLKRLQPLFLLGLRDPLGHLGDLPLQRLLCILALKQLLPLFLRYLHLVVDYDFHFQGVFG